jgi:hypothetical protein
MIPRARTFTATGARRDASLDISLATRRMTDVLHQSADTQSLDDGPFVRLAGLEHGIMQGP